MKRGDKMEICGKKVMSVEAYCPECMNLGRSKIYANFEDGISKWCNMGVWKGSDQFGFATEKHCELHSESMTSGPHFLMCGC